MASPHAGPGYEVRTNVTTPYSFSTEFAILTNPQHQHRAVSSMRPDLSVTLTCVLCQWVWWPVDQQQAVLGGRGGRPWAVDRPSVGEVDRYGLHILSSWWRQ